MHIINSPNIPEIQSITNYIFVVNRAIVRIGNVIKAVESRVHTVMVLADLSGIKNLMKFVLAVMIATGKEEISKKK